MRKLIIASVKMLYRDKQTIIFAFIFPILFAVVFGLFDFNRGPQIHVAVASPASNPVSEAFLTQLKALKTFTVTPETNVDFSRSELSKGHFDIVVAVHPTTGSSSEVVVYYDAGNAARNGVALSAVRQVSDALNLELAGVRTPPIALQTQPVSARTVKYYDFLLPGLVAMGVMNFSIIGMSVAIARYREQRILKRILATPLHPSRFLAAQVIARLLLAVVQAGIIIAVGVTLFHAHIYGNVLSMFVLAALANLVFLNIAFAVAGRAPNPDAAQGIGNVVAIPMMFLSGVFFPTDTLPKVLQTVVKFLPLTPLIKALRRIAVDGLSITSTGTQIWQLGVWVVVSFVVASRLFRFSEA